MKKSALAFIVVLFIFYLSGCFLAASFSIKEWDLFLRACVVFTALGFGGIAFGIVFENKK